MTQIKFGIIGTGNIAKFHAEAIRAAEGAVLTAVCDKVPERADTFAEEMGVAAEYDLKTFLDRDDIDAVTIATPSGAHADVAIPAARAGKHILCEKPLEINVDRVNQIITACEENNVTLACVFQSRLNKNVQQIRKAIKSGRFGKLVLASAQVHWFRSQEYYDSGKWRGTWQFDGGGALMNQSIHIIDLLVYLVGQPELVYAFTNTLTHTDIEVEDTSAAVIKFANGAMGTIEASTSCAPGFPRRLEISGETGSVVLEDDRLTRWSFVESLPEDEKILLDGTKSNKPKGNSSNPTAMSHEGHCLLIEDLCRVIQTGSEPLISGREGLRAVELICGVYESAQSGKAYKIIL